MGLIIFVLWIVSIFWVFTDASDSKGGNIGCMWSLIVFITGPLGLIAYLFARNMD